MTLPPPAPALVAITGGANGIGAAIARRYAADGRHIALLDHDDAAGRTLAQEIGPLARHYPCDVRDAAALDGLARQLTADGAPPLHALVVAAALIPEPETVLNMDMARHEQLWEVNYFGALHTCRAFGRRMAEQRHGSIVVLGSINSMMPLPLPAYNPAKAALARLVQLLAVELGPHGVRINSVAPTVVMTAGLQARLAAGLRDAQRLMETHALPYLPNPEDVAASVEFLSSDAARCITGATLVVDAGWSSTVSYRNYAGHVPG